MNVIAPFALTVSGLPPLFSSTRPVPASPLIVPPTVNVGGGGGGGAGGLPPPPPPPQDATKTQPSSTPKTFNMIPPNADDGCAIAPLT